ncbi:hypothetical protein M422DRAFT_135101, partial [Sphaerobolus stellatus SS14]
LIAVNLNLPPDIHCHVEEVFCLGVIPGPKQPKDFDSFLWPLFQEANELAMGVPAYDIIEDEIFDEHAFICLGGGDI